MTITEAVRDSEGDRVTCKFDAAMAPVDIVLAEARRLRAQELDRLLRTGLSHCTRVVVSLIAPMFGWRRHAVDQIQRHDRQASLTDYVKALRADAETSKKDHWLGHGA